LAMNRIPLEQLARRYFKRFGYEIIDIDTIKTKTDIFKINFIVRRHGEDKLVIIKDWRRTVGVNKVIDADLISIASGYKVVLVARKFSSRARKYAERRGVELLDEYDLID